MSAGKLCTRSSRGRARSWERRRGPGLPSVVRAHLELDTPDHWRRRPGAWWTRGHRGPRSRRSSIPALRRVWLLRARDASLVGLECDGHAIHFVGQ